MRDRRLKRGRAVLVELASEKRAIFFNGEVFFLLTRPLMGDPFISIRFKVSTQNDVIFLTKNCVSLTFIKTIKWERYYLAKER